MHDPGPPPSTVTGTTGSNGQGGKFTFPWIKWLFNFYQWVKANMGTDYDHEVDAGRVPGVISVRKFGRAVNGVQTTLTDIWDRADSTPTQQIFVAPTAARIHNIVGGAADTNGGAGCNTLQVYGLADWDSKEVSEVVTMNGAGGVNTANAYVIIHRMKCLTWGATGPNVGAITATAATDATVTAQVNAGQGQTQMAIYGVPSTQKVYMDFWYASINKSSGANSDINFSLLANPTPEVDESTFLIKSTRGLQSTGTTSSIWPSPLVIDGPCIIKISGEASTNDIEASAGFKVKLEDK